MRVTVTRPGEEKPRVALGEKSEALHKEVEELEAAYEEQEAREKKLARQVSERETKLTAIRAPAGLVDRVDPENRAAFEKELKGLQKKLRKVRSDLAEISRALREKRRALEEAQLAEAEAALEVEALTEVREALEENAGALQEARAVFLEALEVGPLLEQWQELAKERHKLYARRCGLTDRGDPDTKTWFDPLSKLFPADYDADVVLTLLEALLPLVEVYQGWPRVRGRERQWLW